METNDTNRQASGRRARIVCQRCHSKKIRCDLQRVGSTCSNCLNVAASCEYRPSHKGHYRRKPGSEARIPQNDSMSSTLMEPSASQSSVALNGTKYLRALLGHQTGRDRNSTGGDEAVMPVTQASDNFMPGIMRTYLETYSEVCYTWCPVIDVDDSTMTTESLLLDHSLASVASRVKPPLMPGLDNSKEHYERARHLFYDPRQHSTLTLVRAALLLSCCDNNRLGSPMEGSFWWLGVATRLAQDVRLHRAPRNLTSAYDLGLQRRIWWTLFARERIMALCQGRPCTIDEKDCNLGMPSIADFPEDRSREARIFIHWVKICRIMGELNDHTTTARETRIRIPTQELAITLKAWLQSLPDDLQLPIQSANSAPFVRDVHFLHLSYLTAVAGVYLNSRNQDIPEVSVAAALAAACITRIIRDILLRDCAHALSEDSGWYITIAMIALMHVRPVPSLTPYVTADINVLRSALKHLSGIWHSAKVLATGMEKIVENRPSASVVDEQRTELVSLPSANESATTFDARAHSLQDLRDDDGVIWVDFFPFATTQTSPLVEVLLTECQDTYPDSWAAFDTDFNFDASWDELLSGQVNFFQNVP